MSNLLGNIIGNQPGKWEHNQQKRNKTEHDRDNMIYSTKLYDIS